MNILHYKILYKIIRQENISYIVLKQYINNEAFPFLALANLFYDAHISINSFAQIKAYIMSLINPYLIENQYNYSEQQWYIFYLILNAYGSTKIDSQKIIKEYQSLPKLNTNRIELKWIQYRVKDKILSHYMILKLNYDKIKQEINLIPQEIKDLHF